jgi:UDP-glucose 4-epimerase
MNLLVTGGAGFIGSHVVDWLVDCDERTHKVVVLDDLSGGFRENINKRAIFYQGSINDATLIDWIIESEKIDFVYHLAAYAAEGLSHFIRSFNYTNNLMGSMNLINSSIRHGVKCFVFTSSIAVYGEQTPPMVETMMPRPIDPYGIAKMAVEMDLIAAKKMFGMDYIIFRPHNVYGERQNIGDPYRNVIGIFMNQIMQGLPCTIFGDGEQKRAFTHIASVAPAIAKAPFRAAARNQILNIGAAIPYTVNELLRRVQNVMGKSISPVVYLPPRKEAVAAFSDTRKARLLLDTTVNISLDEGLKRMADWAKLEGARKGKPFAEIEIDKGLPESWRALC